MSVPRHKVYLQNSISGTVRVVQHRGTPNEFVVFDVDETSIGLIVKHLECVLRVGGNLESNYDAYSWITSPTILCRRDRLTEHNGKSDWKAGDKIEVEADLIVEYQMHNGSAFATGVWEGGPTD